jgi:hypothetical protein
MVMSCSLNREEHYIQHLKDVLELFGVMLVVVPRILTGISMPSLHVVPLTTYNS